METKAVIKPATPDLEEDTREHLNIVFIGHVGKRFLSIFLKKELLIT